MVKLIKTIFLFLLLIFLVFLIGTTFFGSTSSNVIHNLSQDIAEYQPGYYSFSGSLLLKNNTIEPDRSSIYMQKISRFETIYAGEDIDFDGYSFDDNTITLGKGLYVLDLNNPTQNYTILASGFHIQTLSPGKIYIDTRDVSKIVCLSLGSSFDLTFLDRVSNDPITNAYIFPNRYISFNTLRNNELKNADFLRISQVVSQYGYLNESVVLSDGTLGDKFSRLIGVSGQDFLTPIFQKIQKDIITDQKKYEDILSLKIWNFPGLEYIKQRFLFFKNDTKKIVFYKNIILTDVDELLRSTTINTPKINEIKNNLDTLRGLDAQQYLFMEQLIIYYTRIVSAHHEDSSDIMKQNFKILLSKLDETIKQQYDYSSLHKLNNVYAKYNFYDDSTHLSDMSRFVNIFFEDLGVEKNDNDIINIRDESNITDYFSSYLQSLLTQILLSHISSDKTLSNDTLAGTLDIINENISLGKYIYFTQPGISDSRKQTGLYQNLDFIIILEKFLRNNLFLSERNESNLLVPKSDLGVRESIIRLNENTDNMFELYTTYQSVAGKNANKLKAYNILKNKLYEYFIAIKSYDRYTQEFDEVVSKVGDTQVYLGDEGGGISKSEFLKYISQFVSVNSSSMQVEVVEGEYYRVTNLVVAGSRMDFELYPLRGNTMESITIDFKSVNGSYKLDERELDLEEKFRIARGEDRDKYDFRRFFINTFFTQKSNDDSPEFVDTNDTLVESKSIQTFKKSKLLGEGREFSFVDDYLPLTWEQVVVSQGASDYDISILDALYLSQETRTQLHAQFNSKYIFTNTSHKFENIEVKMYERYSQNKTAQFSLGGNTISFIGAVHIADFNTVSEDFFYQIGLLQSVYSNIIRELDPSNMKISYYPSNDQIKITFLHNSDTISMTLGNDQILFLKKNSKTVANQLKTSTLPSALQQIK